MSEHLGHCERFEAMMEGWFDGSLPECDRRDLSAHVATCASCRESFELSARMEHALASRRFEVPTFAAFLPRVAATPVRASHGRLVAAFRVLMSPAGIGAVLVIWVALLTLRFSDVIGGALTRFSEERLMVFSRHASDALLDLAGGNAYTLIAVYALLALALLASTGAITLRYIRHS
jgi:hypothetical protein